MGFFDDLDFPENPKLDRGKASNAPTELKAMPIVNIPYVEFTDGELYEARGSVLTFDIEIYPNYFLAAFRSVETHKVVTFELTPDKPQFDATEMSKLWWVAMSFTLVTFNGIKFDMPLLAMAGHNCSIAQIKEAADKLITLNQRAKKGEKGYMTDSNKGYRPRDVEKDYNVTIPTKGIDHIDLIEVAPGQHSLKLYNGRLHGARLQDLPYKPDKHLTYSEAVNVRFYCVNDLDATESLYRKLKTEIELRETMSEEYGIDLRSLSDAQIAEHVLVSRCAEQLGYRPKRPSIPEGTSFYYEPPAYMKFKTPYMQEVFEAIVGSPFVINGKGQPISDYLHGLKVKIGKMTYAMGVGGLHSTEKMIAHWADWLRKLYDSDVASYYPSMMLNNGYAPEHLGDVFLQVYRHIVETRLNAKALAKSPDPEIARINKVAADSLKIVINGTFGKLGSKYSLLYSPHLLVQVTVTGQLSLLMLIEALELEGIEVVSANTDGVVIKPEHAAYDRSKEIVAEWERVTSLEMEETQYKGILSRDVNNYIAIKKNYDKERGWVDDFPEGTKLSKLYKGKGIFGDDGLRKTPNCGVCAKAIAEMLTRGTPIVETIEANNDLRDYVVVKNVKGGAHKDGWELGKVVRFYYSSSVEGTINYITNGNTVGNSQNGVPCQDLPATLPSNLDKEFYVNMTETLLGQLGYYTKTETDDSTSLFVSEPEDEELDNEYEES